MIKPIKIKDIEIKNNLFLAPMAGYTDVGFRSLCKQAGAGLTYTEMVSAKALAMGSKKTKELLNIANNEKPVAVQLFGNDPEAFKLAIISGELDKFDIIDINMGCPAPKIVANHEGSFLMTDIIRAEQIIKACVSCTTKPVTVKFRSGFDENNINAVEFAKMCERAGASLITIHPRTKTQGYAGHSDWAMVKKVADAVNIPVLASGDVFTRVDVDYLTDECGADGVMIGRATLGNPEIFKEILTNKSRPLSLKKKLDQIKAHIETLARYYSDKFIYLTMKKHILNYLKSFNGATKLKQQVVLCSSLEEMLKIIQENA